MLFSMLFNKSTRSCRKWKLCFNYWRPANYDYLST